MLRTKIKGSQGLPCVQSFQGSRYGRTHLTTTTTD